MSFYRSAKVALSMSIKIEKINKIFIKKMMSSLLAQLFILSLLIYFVRNYIDDNQVNNISNELLIKDEYTLEKIAQYHLLQSNYALDLELHNLGEIKKLDSIKFVKILPRYQCNILNLKRFKLCKLSDTYLGISVITANRKILGYVLATKKYHSFISTAAIYDFLLILLSIFGIFIINIGLLFLPLKKKIENNTQFLLDFISKESYENTVHTPISIEEYKAVANQFVHERNKITLLQEEKSYYEAKKNIAEQVAHDIRSPLAAISTVVTDISSIPENRRVIIKNAAKRIDEIANNLLLSSKVTLMSDQKSYADERLVSEVILIILENLITEKQYEYLNKKTIQLMVDDNAHNCFAAIHLASFKRVLSNLINNSIEASVAEGIVRVKLHCLNDKIYITIIDNGCGIPPDILPKIMEQGFSYGKKSGVGFGLYHAKQQITRFNGQLFVESEVNVGTQITIMLPQCNPPRWFCDTLAIKQDACILILDDDPSIHDAWESKFCSWPTVKRVHFSRAADLTPQKVNELKPDLYLIDYELLKEACNGLDIIESLKINNYSYLVTSSFEENNVRCRAEMLNVKIIPKSYVPYLPIHLVSINDHLVLIDDDDTICVIWELAATEAGKTIDIYKNPNDFMTSMHQYNKNTTIYIDSDLKGDMPGEIYAKHFYEKGFREIHLASGYEAEKFSQMNWIKSIIGKAPPF